MKKKLSLFLFVFISLTSCTLMKSLKQQEVKNNNAEFNFNKNKSLVYFETLLDNKKVNFLFDTGATISIITDSTSVSDFSSKTFNSVGSVKGANRKKIKRKMLVASIENPLFLSKNKVFSYINMVSTDICEKKNEFQGILGLDVFFQNDLLMLMDFSNNKISNISDSDKNLMIKNGFKKIKSECKMNQLFIFLKIENVEYKFKLDTGFSGNIVIPFNDKLNFEKQKKIVYEGQFFQTVSGRTNGEEVFYENLPVNIGGIITNSKILVSKSIKAQNIGLNFIKGFDWIIDFYKNEVFIKKNQFEIENQFESNLFKYKVANYTDSLIITTKQKQQIKYNLNDQITTINNIKVTPENICEMQELLNKTQDWDTLNLVTIPAVK